VGDNGATQVSGVWVMFEIGESLREARSRRKVGLSEVEKSTRIRVQQLEALEQEQFDLLPPDPYRRSFLREYAEFLGLDGDLYTSEYDRRFAAAEPVVLPARRSGRGPRPPSKGPLISIAAVALVVLVGVAVWLLGRSGGTGSITPPATTLAHARTTPRPHSRHRVAATPAPKRSPLVLTAARGSCWLWVRTGSSTGQTIYQQTLQPGQTLRFSLRGPLWIRIGAPWNLDATIGQRSLTPALPSRTGDVLATTTGIRPAP
jgi:Helix-turn-helix domain/RodZ C-terminal domain